MATFSALSTVSSDGSQLNAIYRTSVFSADEIPEVFSSATMQLEAFFSESMYVYLNNITHAALLPMDGAEQASFTLDVDSARFENYTAMLEAAGLAN